MSNSGTNNVTVKKFTKNAVYKNEQKAVFDELMEILEIIPDDKKSCIRKDKLEEKIENILTLHDKFKEYYDSTVTKYVNRTPNKAMCILKHILKHHGYKLKYKIVGILKNDKWGTIQSYYIVSL